MEVNHSLPGTARAAEALDVLREEVHAGLPHS